MRRPPFFQCLLKPKVLRVPSQVHRHDLPSEDRWDGPQRSAAPPGNHRGLPERPRRFSQAVSLSLLE